MIDRAQRNLDRLDALRSEGLLKRSKLYSDLIDLREMAAKNWITPRNECIWCAEPFERVITGRRRLTCSDACRKALSEWRKFEAMGHVRWYGGAESPPRPRGI